MFEALKNFLETDFEKELFEEIFTNLQNKQSKIRCNNFAYAMRSLIDYIFEQRIAPDEKVKKATWYKKISDDRDVARMQRYKYSIQGEIDDYFIDEIIKFKDIDKISKDFNNAVHSLSKYTHISQKTFNLSDKETDNFVKDVERAVTNFFENIILIKDKLMDSICIWLYDSINDAFISETIQEIDELCTHYSIDYVNVEDIEILDKDENSLLYDISAPFEIEVTGQVEVEHQFGSDGDYRRGDGYRYNESYPFTVRYKINIPLIKELIDGDEEYDCLKDYSQSEKEQLNKTFMDEFYENVELTYRDVNTSKHYE